MLHLDYFFRSFFSLKADNRLLFGEDDAAGDAICNSYP